MTGNQNRRRFVQVAAAGLAAGSLVGPAFGEKASRKSKPAFTLGMASYTFRKFTLDQTLAMTRRLGLDKIAFKNMHLPLDSPQAEIEDVVRKVRQAGLELYGCGVVYMKTEAEVQQAFDYARAAGMKVIIGVPDHGLLDAAEARVKEYDISLAIHNHGPGDKLYPTPESVYEKVKGRDPRMGLCLDVGHTMRGGQDPAKAVEAFSDRLWDMHIKDVSAPTPEANTVEIGRGVIDIPALLEALDNVKYAGVVSLEYEKDEDDPLPGSAESIGYLRGVLRAM